MKIGSLFWAAIAATTLVACSTTRPPELNPFTRPFFKTQTCSGASCPVTVTVTENAATGTCSATVDYGVLDLSQGAGAKTIAWTISDGYKFSNESYKFAIVIKTDPKGQFRNAKVQAGGKRLVLDFVHSSAGNSYTYGLNFQRDNGTDSFCDMLDPYMVD